MYRYLYPLLFRLDAERAHGLALSLMRLAGSFRPLNTWLRARFTGPSQPVNVFGLSFRNRLGLAAGYDKDGLGWRGLACLGFGHIEVGTVTPRAQSGNPKPRLFRLPEERALINRMGFPGRGADFVARRLLGPRPPGLVLGVNIGKNKDTPLEHAAEDYISLLKVFAPLVDYMTINVSSPNTIGLRRLQAKETLSGLLQGLAEERKYQVASLGRNLPLLVKVAPDLTEVELGDALDVILNYGMDGIVATNTTISRQGLLSPLASESGGLSGEPLHARSLEIVQSIVHLTGAQLPVIGVGGVMDAAGVQRMLDAGAELVQVYTGLIYGGPGLVHNILRELVCKSPGVVL